MKLLIFGNSGSGKSTLAASYAASIQVSLLDLDTLAWLPTTPPQRAPLQESKSAIFAFINAHNDWVIEGCYTDLLEMVADQADEIVFMNLDVLMCTENARKRPWEPHKYPSKEAQDENLPMLIQWIEDYHQRDDVFSFAAHSKFYAEFKGAKRMIEENSGLNKGGSSDKQ